VSLFQVRAASLLWIKFMFVTLRAAFLHPVKGTPSLQRKLAPWQNSRAAFLQQREVRISTSKSVSLQQSESCISTSMFASPQWMRVTFLLQTKSASPRQYDLCVYKTCVKFLLLQLVQQYTGESRRLFPRFNSTPTTSSEHQGGLDYVSRHSRRSSLMTSKSLTVHSRRPTSR